MNNIHGKEIRGMYEEKKFLNLKDFQVFMISAQ